MSSPSLSLPLLSLSLFRSFSLFLLLCTPRIIIFRRCSTAENFNCSVRSAFTGACWRREAARALPCAVIRSSNTNKVRDRALSETCREILRRPRHPRVGATKFRGRRREEGGWDGIRRRFPGYCFIAGIPRPGQVSYRRDPRQTASHDNVVRH